MLWLIDWLIYLVGFFNLLRLLDFLHNSIKTVSSKPDLSVYGKGSWALVTACTDGIGRAFVRELAQEGFNIVLVSRNPSKLEEEACYLEKNFGVETLRVTKDFSECHKKAADFFEDLYEQVKLKDISIVVNNVGGMKFSLFQNYSFRDLETLSSMNLWPIAFISRLIVPDMIKRKNKGAIINLSSMAAEVVNTKNIIYNASKGFDKKLSLIMKLDLDQTEKNSSGIDVLCLMPAIVKTPLTENVKTEILQIEPNVCVRGALNCLGKVDMTYGHWKHVLAKIGVHLIGPVLPILSLAVQITKDKSI